MADDDGEEAAGTTMRAAFCRDGPRLRENEARYEVRGRVPVPALDGLPPGSVLLKTAAASICGTDLFGRNPPTGRRPIPYLNELGPACGGSGHELLGRIIAVVRPSQKEFEVGDVVLAMSSTYIRKMTGLGKLFEQATKQSKEILPHHGGFAEYFVSHECCCVPIPSDSVLLLKSNNNSSDNAPPYNYYHVAAQPLGTILHALRMLDRCLVDKNVAIVGQGPNGLMMTQMVANSGARRVVVLDLIEERLEVAKRRFHATHTVHVTDAKGPIDPYVQRVRQITHGEMCHVVVEMVGHQNDTIRLCNELTQDGGTVLLFGILTEDGISIRVRDFARNLKYACSSSPDYDDFVLAMDMISQGRFDPVPLFSHTASFAEQFPQMYAKASEYKDGVIKVLFTFDDNDE